MDSILQETNQIGEDKIKCQICKEELDRSALELHFNTHHNEKPSGNMCEICEKTFSTRKGKEMHINNIRGELKPNNFKCDICDKSFSKSHSLRLHIYTFHESNIGHGNDHKCQSCGKSFFEAAIMKNHVYIHSLLRLCDFSFPGKLAETEIRVNGIKMDINF